MNEFQNYGPLMTRIALGALFIISGLNKLSNPAGTAGFLANLGFSGAGFWAWVLLLSEITFGLLILIGWLTKLTIWPLVIIMLVAIFKVYLPAYLDGQAAAKTNLLFHILTLASLLSLFFTGAGAWSLEKVWTTKVTQND